MSAQSRTLCVNIDATPFGTVAGVSRGAGTAAAGRDGANVAKQPRRPRRDGGEDAGAVVFAVSLRWSQPVQVRRVCSQAHGLSAGHPERTARIMPRDARARKTDAPRRVGREALSQSRV